MTGRARAAPAEVRGLAPGERLLGFARCEAGWVLATVTALHLPGAAGGRLAWDQVHRADWHVPVLGLTVQRAAGGPLERIALELSGEPGQLPTAVRDRVTASIVAERHVGFDGERGARFLVRRTESGELRWVVLIDPGVDPDDPAVVVRVDAELRRLQSAWGV
ncbi:MAG TPA: hypothetical protein VFN19_00580 [Candidatus Nanopelagicales bacterium]|nr:hypothetical protein [Candidatus Nanopelagicales bacterium]